MSIEHAGYIITVTPAGLEGWYWYRAQGYGQPTLKDYIQANDEADAADKVCMMIDEER